MDALKKAEEEKKKAAAELQREVTGETPDRDPPIPDVPDPADESGDRSLALAPDDDASVPPPADSEDVTAVEIPEASPLSLAPLDEPTTTSELDRSAPAADDTTRETGADTTSRSARGPEQPYDQESTLPSERSIKSSLQEYFESSQSMESSQLSRSEDGSKIDAETKAAEDDASLVGARVTAQTVFAAKQDSGSRAIALVIFAVALVAVMLGAVGVYYYQQTPEPRIAPSPTVAKGIEAIEKHEYVFPDVVPQNLEAAPVAVQDATEFELTDAQAVAMLDAEPLVAEPEVRAGLTQADVATLETPLADAGAEALPLLQTPTEDLSALAVEQTPAVTPQAIQITRHSAQQLGPDPGVVQAYQAYQRGDLAAAEAGYREVLATSPEHRDALLGMSAISVRQGQTETALRNYQRLLMLDPSDAVARAGMATLLGAEFALGESQLKTLLSQAPEASYLNFALGNTYARASR